MARLTELPAGQEKARAVREMFDRVAPRYDLVNRVMTFGMDTGWRRKSVEALGLERGSVVLDIACGTGDLCREIAHAGMKPIGFDFSAGMLRAATVNAPLVQADALALPVREAAADGVTCGFALRNVTDLAELFAELARVTRSAGRVALLEVAEPQSPLPRTLHRAYFHRVVPLIGGALSDRSAYRYLPASTAYLPPPAEMAAMLREAGFRSLQRKLLGMGAAQLLTATRR